MSYYLIPDFGLKAECDSIDEVYDLFGGKEQATESNFGVLPEVFEIDLDDYEEDDGLDCI